MRQRAAARLLARRALPRRAGEPGHLRRRPDAASPDRRGALRPAPDTARAGRAGAAPALPRHRGSTTRSWSGVAGSTTGSTPSRWCAPSTGSGARFPTSASSSWAWAIPTPPSRRWRGPSSCAPSATSWGSPGPRSSSTTSGCPYTPGASYLLDADVAVSIHLDNLETRFSFRTRVLDYLWARRPMILTGGDALGELVAARGLGITVAPGDVDAIAAALVQLLSDGPARGGLRADTGANSSGRSLRPWCAGWSARRAPDVRPWSSDDSGHRQCPVTVRRSLDARVAQWQSYGP